MKNIDHLRAIDTESMAWRLARASRFHCGDCIAAFPVPGTQDIVCPAFLAAIERQEKETGNSRTTETYRFVDDDACVKNMVAWLEAEADPSEWRFDDIVKGR